MISIITSLYRSDRYIRTYSRHLVDFCDGLSAKNIDFEIIIIANDPTEKEQTLRDDFGSKSWFKFVEVDREPLYASWNRGVDLAKGDVIGFWNVDDIRKPEAIIDGLQRINDGAEVVYYPFIIKWYINLLTMGILVKWRSIVPPPYERREFTRSMHCGPFFIFKKSLYEAIGPFDEQFKIVGDFDWCIRAAKYTDKFVLSKENAGIFRVDGNGLSSGGKPMHVAENNIVYIRHGISDKIVEIDQALMQPYQSDTILHNGTYAPIHN